MRYPDLDLPMRVETAGQTALSQLILIDTLIAQSTECIVHVESMPHHQAVNSMKPLLFYGQNLNLTFNRHINKLSQ